RSKRAQVRTVWVGGPKIPAARARRTEYHPSTSRRHAGLQVAAEPVREVAQPVASLKRDRDRYERAAVINDRAHESSTVRRLVWLSVFADSCCETLRLVLGRRTPPEIKIDPIRVRCVEQTSGGAGKRE